MEGFGGYSVDLDTEDLCVVRFLRSCCYFGSRADGDVWRFSLFSFVWSKGCFGNPQWMLLCVK